MCAIGSCLHVITILIFYVLHVKVRSVISMIGVEIVMTGTARCRVRWVAIVLSWLFSRRERRGKLKLPLPLLLSLYSRHLCLFLYVSCHHHLRVFLWLLFLALLRVQWHFNFLSDRVGSAIRLSRCVVFWWASRKWKEEELDAVLISKEEM